MSNIYVVSTTFFGDLYYGFMIYNNGDRSYFRDRKEKTKELAEANDCLFLGKERPYGIAVPGHWVIVDYFYNEGSENLKIAENEIDRAIRGADVASRVIGEIRGP